MRSNINKEISIISATYHDNKDLHITQKVLVLN